MQPQPNLMFQPPHISLLLPQPLDLSFLLISLTPDLRSDDYVIRRHQFRHLADAARDVVSSVREVI